MRRWSELPLARAGLGLAIGFPALLVGGVWPQVVVAFVGLMVLVWLRLIVRQGGHLRWPTGITVAWILIGVTVLQWAPLPATWVQLLAPGIADGFRDLPAEVSSEPWTRISVVPGNTAVEVARLVGLLALFVAAAQVSWRFVAVTIVVTAVAVAVVGLVHELVGAQAIFGWYWPKERSLAIDGELATTFVNPNHQSALFLLGLFAAAALVADLRDRDDAGLDLHAYEARRERTRATQAAMGLLAFALLLSLSRGTLVVAVVVGVVARVVVGKSSIASHRWARGSVRPTLRRASSIGALILLVVAVGRHGAWQQLATLWEPSAFTEKFQVVREAWSLVAWSPILGIGRGSFVDVFPLLGTTTVERLYTHVENWPMAYLVEWGPVVGGGAIVFAVAWFVRAWRLANDRGTKFVWFGLVAVVLQNGADFNLEYLGVAAPTVALAGTVGPRVRTSRWLRFLPHALVVALLASLAIAGSGVPGTWSSTQQWKRQHLDAAGEDSIREALRWRPLDGDLYLALARRAAAREDWPTVERWGRAVLMVRVDAVEARLLVAQALRKSGHDEEADDLMRAALKHLRGPIDAALASYLLELEPDPDRFARWLPVPTWPAKQLAEQLLPLAPQHVEAVACRWEALAVGDVDPLLLRARAALARHQVALALHFARLAAARFPRSAAAYLTWATALRKFVPSREPEVAGVFEQALRHDLDEPAAVEEQLVAAYLRTPVPPVAERAHALIESLLARPASSTVRRRRADLVARLRARLDREEP